MKVDVLSAVTVIFCACVCITLLDLGALVSFAQAAVATVVE